MGHYLSEMMTASEAKALRDEEDRRKKRILTRIKADLKKRGIAKVLADIVDDPQMYRIHLG